MIKRILIVINITLLAACSTTKEAAPSGGSVTTPAAGIEMETMERTEMENVGFDGNFFREICLLKSNENVCISPLSAQMALTMAAVGAEGETRSEILGCLQPGDDLNAEANHIITEFEDNNDEYEARLANSIWINNTLEVKDNFLITNRELLRAEANAVPFNNATVERINSWCSEQTNGKIPTILSELSPNDRMVILNSVYFKAKWKKQFNKNSTTTEPFTKDDGEVVDAKMMNQVFRTGYYEDEYVQVASKPFESRFEMLLILPKESIDYSTAIDKVAESLTEYRSCMEQCELTLSMPRFRYEFATSLKPALSNLGIEKAFDNRADFSGISDAPLYISDVIQKTYINVEEEGAEAAGVTSIYVGLMSAPRPAERKIMTLDRPFIYAIVDNSTGAVLFAGRVTEPLQGE